MKNRFSDRSSTVCLGLARKIVPVAQLAPIPLHVSRSLSLSLARARRTHGTRKTKEAMKRIFACLPCSHRLPFLYTYFSRLLFFFFFLLSLPVYRQENKISNCINNLCTRIAINNEIHRKTTNRQEDILLEVIRTRTTPRGVCTHASRVVPPVFQV